MPFDTTKTGAFQASLWLMKPCKLLNEASLVSHAEYPGSTTRTPAVMLAAANDASLMTTDSCLAGLTTETRRSLPDPPEYSQPACHSLPGGP